MTLTDGPILRRMRLRRADGRIYLDRWGIQLDRIGRVYLHRMDAPDPGIDLHDHPWWFASIVLKGSYIEHGRCWTLVIGGPRRRRWGFYTATGYVDERTYDETVGADRRDLWNEVGS